MGLLPQITERNFEIIRDGIGTILAYELGDQLLTSEIVVYRERTIPFDKSEKETVNVSFDSANYTNENPKSKEAHNRYFIDVQVNAKHTASDQGDTLAALRCQRVAGIIDYIFSSAEYYELGFTKGFIWTRWISDINVGPISQGDSLHSYVARLILNVRANEEVGNINGTPQQVISSSVQINETDKGYRFEYIVP